jgi:ketosteroid isomerase-like protein
LRDGAASAAITAIARIHDAWIRYERHNQPERVLALCSDRIRWIPPDGPEISGKYAVTEWLRRNPVKIQQLETSHREIWLTGRLASLRATFEVCTGDPGAELPTFRGRHHWVLEIEPDGEWRVVVVSWSVDAEVEP